jgi:L-lactate dehydrogenase complex protein LldE
MRVALFIPCYVDQLRPQLGMASLRLLEACGLEVEFPEAQTCCGQPLLNSGGRAEACRLAHRFLDVFANYDRIVCPSASCVATVTRHYRELLGESPRLREIEERTRELCDFLVEEQGDRPFSGRFPYRVGLHASCHALRQLRQGEASERVQEAPAPDPARQLLAALDGLSFAPLQRADECCGFGGSFALEEPAVSARMGLDRLEDHRSGGAEVIASSDVSCLLHLEGLARRQGLPLRALHVAEILAEALDAS